MEQELEAAYSESWKLRKSKYKYNESIRKLNEKVRMLENVVSNRDMEVNLLGEKLDSFEASASPEATTSCKVCAKETDS